MLDALPQRWAALPFGVKLPAMERLNLRRFSGMRVPMRWPALALAAIGALTLGAAAQTPIDVQPVKELKPTDTLATCAYRPTAEETPFFSHLNEAEKSNDT